MAQKARENPKEEVIILIFDYSKNILVPQLVVRPGMFYFTSRRKIDMFEIDPENTNKQLVDNNGKIIQDNELISNHLIETSHICLHCSNGAKYKFKTFIKLILIQLDMFLCSLTIVCI